MLMHGLGVRLGKTLGEIGDIPHDEMLSWLAYFELTKENAR